MAAEVTILTETPPQNDLVMGSFKTTGESGHDVAIQAGFVPNLIISPNDTSVIIWFSLMGQVYMRNLTSTISFQTLPGEAQVAREIDTLDDTAASVIRGESGASAGFVVNDALYDDGTAVFFTR